MDKWPPLLAGAHDVNHPLLPGTQGHDVDGQVETHARRKAEHRGIAKDHGFEPGTCEISQFLLYAQLAFGVKRLRPALVVLGQPFAKAVAVDRCGARVDVSPDAGLLCQPRQTHASAAVDRAGQLGINLGRRVVAEPGEVDDDLDAAQNLRIEVAYVLCDDCRSVAQRDPVDSVLAKEKPVEGDQRVAALEQLFAERHADVAAGACHQHLRH